MDKFKLFKSERFKIALKHKVPYEDIIKHEEDFTIGCCCGEIYPAGWYRTDLFHYYEKL